MKNPHFLCKFPVVYRGCANQENLPLGVSSYNRQCQYQAGSLWFFCDGDLCNSKQLGKVCAYKPAYKPKSRFIYVSDTSKILLSIVYCQ